LARIAFARFAERAWGIPSLPWILWPFIAVEFLKFRIPYGLFKKSRSVLPPVFWQRKGVFRHYVRLIWQWQGCPSLYYDRLQSSAWRKNIRVTGTPPHRLPGWGERPVVLGFMHNSGFTALRYWLRAQGIPAATFAWYVDAMYHRCQHVRDAGDRLYGLDGVPHIFFGRKAMRETLKFLSPGHLLLVALDGYVTPTDIPYHVNGRPIYFRDGAARMAAATNAILQPVSILQRSFSSFDIHFGDPIPDDVVRCEDGRAATQRLGEELWGVLEKNPDAISWVTLKSLHPEGPAQ
jgi:hypothetical protein